MVVSTLRKEFMKLLEHLREDGLVTTGNMVVRRMRNTVLKKWFEFRSMRIEEREWDTLILLDACRYDYFQNTVEMEGELSRVVSKGNNSWEFMEENFEGKEYHDTVYVTANPFVNKLEDGIFHAIESVLDKWDPNIGVVPPQRVTKKAIECHQDYPDKRIIVHYMQPHTPHLGEIGKRVQEEFEVNGRSLDDNKETGVSINGKTIWDVYRDGHITNSELRESYQETLEIVMRDVESLVTELNGKIVISSDHGENLGEGKSGERLSHGMDTKECRYVPWFELPYDDGRSVSEEEPIEYERHSEEFVKEKLQSLGYLQE